MKERISKIEEFNSMIKGFGGIKEKFAEFDGDNTTRIEEFAIKTNNGAVIMYFPLVNNRIIWRFGTQKELKLFCGVKG